MSIEIIEIKIKRATRRAWQKIPPKQLGHLNLDMDFLANIQS